MMTEIKSTDSSVKEKIPIDRIVSLIKELSCGTEQRGFISKEQITSVY